MRQAEKGLKDDQSVAEHHPGVMELRIRGLGSSRSAAGARSLRSLPSVSGEHHHQPLIGTTEVNSVINDEGCGAGPITSNLLRDAAISAHAKESIVRSLKVDPIALN